MGRLPEFVARVARGQCTPRNQARVRHFADRVKRQGQAASVTTVHPKFNWPSGSYSRMETTNFKITSRVDAPRHTYRGATRVLLRTLDTVVLSTLGSARRYIAAFGRSKHKLATQTASRCRAVQRPRRLSQDARRSRVQNWSFGRLLQPGSTIVVLLSDDNLQATLYHELTHQLLGRSIAVEGTAQGATKVTSG